MVKMYMQDETGVTTRGFHVRVLKTSVHLKRMISGSFEAGFDRHWPMWNTRARQDVGPVQVSNHHQQDAPIIVVTVPAKQ